MGGRRGLVAIEVDDDLGFDSGEVPVADVNMDVDLKEVLKAVPAYLKDLLKEFFEGGEESDDDEEESDREEEDLADLCAMMDGYEAGQEPADRRVDVRRLVAATITIFISSYEMGCRHDKMRGRDLASKLAAVAVEVRKYDEEAAATVGDLAERVGRAVEAARVVSG